MRMQLVLSDEFSTDNQTFRAADGNTKWTAGNMWYSGTGDWEVYVPEQASASQMHRPMACMRHVA